MTDLIEPKGDYCIEVQFEKGTDRPARVFQAMSQLIESFQAVDGDLAKSVAANIEAVVVLQEVEAGSIRAWLATILNSVDDDALKNLDWKKWVGSYLLKGKRKVVEFLEGKDQIENQAQLRGLENGLLTLAMETQVRQIPAYSPVPSRRLLADLNSIGQALSQLSSSDSAAIIMQTDRFPFNLSFRVPEATIEELLTNESLHGEVEMILKVKKPDFLGSSMWEFRHEKRVIEAKVVDKIWLQKFQSREVLVRPGDSIHARVSTTVFYDQYGEVVSQRFDVTEVIKIIPLPPWDQNTQLPLNLSET